MNTVIIINLNGNAFHLEEPGFQSLQAYLQQAQAALKDNPDKSEIMADLEQAIADKCAHFLRPHKNVLTAAEIDEILQEMGPVQSDAGAEGGASAGANLGNGPNRGLQERSRRYQRSETALSDSRGGNAERRLHRIGGLLQHRRHNRAHRVRGVDALDHRHLDPGLRGHDARRSLRQHGRRICRRRRRTVQRAGSDRPRQEALRRIQG